MKRMNSNLEHPQAGGTGHADLRRRGNQISLWTASRKNFDRSYQTVPNPAGFEHCVHARSGCAAPGA